MKLDFLKQENIDHLFFDNYYNFCFELLLNNEFFIDLKNNFIYKNELNNVNDLSQNDNDFLKHDFDLDDISSLSDDTFDSDTNSESKSDSNNNDNNDKQNIYLNKNIENEEEKEEKEESKRFSFRKFIFSTFKNRNKENENLEKLDSNTNSSIYHNKETNKTFYEKKNNIQKNISNSKKLKKKYNIDDNDGDIDDDINSINNETEEDNNDLQNHLLIHNTNKEDNKIINNIKSENKYSQEYFKNKDKFLDTFQNIEKNTKKEKEDKLKNKINETKNTNIKNIIELNEFNDENDILYKKYKNKNILILNNCTFNPFHVFQNVIKKYNLKITLHMEDIEFKNKLLNDIKNEENEKNINIICENPFMLDNILPHNHYDYIMIHHSSIYDNNLMNLLKKIYVLLKNEGLIYLYHGICNQQENNVKKKNFIRKQIKKITKLPIGNLKNLIEFNEELLTIKNYYIKINSSLIIKKKYIIFGEYNLYQFILKKIIT